MTSPGGSWFDDYLNGNSPNWGPVTPPPAPAPTAPRPPDRPVYGSADANEHNRESANPGGQTGSDGSVLGPTKSYGGIGSALFDILNMPDNVTGNEVYVQRVTPQGQIIEWTVTQGLGWLRALVYSDPDAYNEVIRSLYAAGYLDAKDVRFGVYSNAIGQAFVDAAYDASANALGEDQGGAMPFMSYLDNVAASYAALGNGPGSSGGSGADDPIRQDQWYDEEGLRSTLDTAAKDVLGRKLNPDEEAALVAQFRGIEQNWNNAQWDATQAAAAGNPVSVTQRPDPSAYLDDDAIQNDPTLQQEAGEVRLASYINVMKNMMGIGSGGVIGAAR